jgi:hypothetical protein
VLLDVLDSVLSTGGSGAVSQASVHEQLSGGFTETPRSKIIIKNMLEYYINILLLLYISRA